MNVNYELLLAGMAVFAVSFVFPIIATGITNVYGKATLAIGDFILSVASFIMVAKALGGDLYALMFTIMIYLWICLIWRAVVGETDPYGAKAKRKQALLDKQADR